MLVLQDPKCITRCRHTQLMDSWLTGCEQTTSTSTDITNAALDKKVAHFNRRLEEIDSKHTKALESHTETLCEVNELVLVCSKEMKKVEGETETVCGIVDRAEERMEKRLGKMERQLEKQAKL